MPTTIMMMMLRFLLLLLVLHVLPAQGSSIGGNNNHLTSNGWDQSNESREDDDNDDRLSADLNENEDGNDDAEEEEDGQDDAKEEDVEAGEDAAGCTDCAQRQAEQSLPPINLTEIRLDRIKQDILNKLKLKGPPNVTLNRDQLPRPLWADRSTALDEYTEVTTDLDDFYGRTEQVVVFPESEGGYRCKTNSHHHPSACLTFKLGSEFPEGEITSAQLWVYKLRNRYDARNQTFDLMEVSPENHHAIKRRSKVIELQTDRKHGWITFDVLHVAKRWFNHFHRNGQQHHSVEVICTTCAKSDNSLPISTSTSHRAFLTLTTDGGDSRSRTKRSANCNPETTHCCREQLFVSFQEIGWSDWIIQPHGYMANYCRGSCLEDVAIPLGRNHHATVMLRVAQNRKFTQAMKLTPCCTPTRMSSISLLYMDDNKVYQKNLPNMVVDSCGCS